MPVCPCWGGRTVCSGTALGTQLPSCSAKPLQAQRKGKDVKCSSPSHHHTILICSLMNSSWRAIKQRETVSFGLRKLDLPCCRAGHLSAAAAGQLWGVWGLCPHTAVFFPSWEPQQPCSRVFWRWNQRDTGFHPEKGQKTTIINSVPAIINSAAGLLHGIPQLGIPLLLVGVVWDDRYVLFWKIYSSHN